MLFSVAHLLLYFHKNSTVLTVFGWTILTERAIKKIERNKNTILIAACQLRSQRTAIQKNISKRMGVRNFIIQKLKIKTFLF